MSGAGTVAGSLDEDFTAHCDMGFEYGAGRVNAVSAGRMQMLREQVGDEPLEGISNLWLYRFAKRMLDIVFSVAVLVCFCWLYAIIAILVKADDPKGPIIFSQDRVGRDGRAVRIQKFRSMCVDAEERLGELQAVNEKTGPVFKIKDDPPNYEGGALAVQALAGFANNRGYRATRSRSNLYRVQQNLYFTCNYASAV